MFKLPRRLGIIERGRIARELELLHHRLRATLLSFKQKCHVNFEFNELGRLILIAPRSSIIQRFETLPRLCVVFLLKWNLREVVLRLAELRIGLSCFFEGPLSTVKLLLLHQDLAT